MGKWQRFKYNHVLPMAEDGKLVTGSKSQAELSRRMASEGMVLLKNDSALSLKKGEKVALFGKPSADYVKGGGGSGDTTVAYVNNLYRAMLKKQEEGKVVVKSGGGSGERAEIIAVGETAQTKERFNG